MTFRPHLVGYPRIGPQRQLKRTLEARWAGKLPAADFAARVVELRNGHLTEQRRLAGTSVDDFYLYDALLETAMAYGLIPDWASKTDPFESLSLLTRGSSDHEAWEMTKWFDTNYHFVVPEIEDSPRGFDPLPWRAPLGESVWSVVGPYTLVALSKATSDKAELAEGIGRALWSWVREQADRGLRLQLDEPALGLVLSDQDEAVLEAAYREASGLDLAQVPMISVQFGTTEPSTLEFLGELGFAVQIPLSQLESLQGTAAWEGQPGYLISVMDGRSVWPDDFSSAADSLAVCDFADKPVWITTSTSLMFLPYTTHNEDLPEGFQFAREKSRALRSWAAALNDGQRLGAPRLQVPEFSEVGELVERASRPQRKVAQADLGLPPYPTTTTGSLPQTAEVRRARAAFRKGELNRAAYLEKMDALIREAVEWQERAGLDVLVHGEFERTDMVEYFGAKMDGFHTTQNGWVLSYGSRCVRPPILAAPPSISEPMTVREWRVAQDTTDKQVKGMLTGPVTIVNWSFRPPGVPDDRLFWAVAQPIAEEVGHLVEAGARVVQIDEPAVRERWPLEARGAAQLQAVYSRGVRAALNLVFNASAHVQMHTHMCYGDFGDIVPLWSDAGVDVASIEYSRSKDDGYIRQFYDLFADGNLQIGPGVFDVHSPHSPGPDVMDQRLAHFLEFMDPSDLWINPDCGLKTRRWEEISLQLGDMVEAARALRSAGG